jgi:hypothetical protein
VGNEVNAEAQESPMLEAVTRKRLMETQQTEKTCDFSGDVAVIKCSHE